MKGWAVIRATSGDIALYHNGSAAIWDWTIKRPREFAKELRLHVKKGYKTVPITIEYPITSKTKKI